MTDKTVSKRGVVTDTEILGFFDEYRFLSNFHVAQLELDGIVYPSAEHAYMAQKVTDRSIQVYISQLGSPGLARKYGQTVPLRPDWDTYRVYAMQRVLLGKFENAELARLLLATGDKRLEETNSWGDKFWGVSGGEGRNRLGELLMEVRQVLRSAASASVPHSHGAGLPIPASIREPAPLDTGKHKQVLVLRKDLGMRKGKMVAQGAHASLGALLAWARENYPGAQTGQFVAIPMDEHIGPWLGAAFTKICVAVDSEQQLLEIYERVTRANLPRALIKDNGLTEFKGVPTYTAVAVGPAEASLVDAITGGLPLL